MRDGWKTTEFWVAVKWWCLTASSVALLLQSTWTSALISLPAVCVLIYMAAAVANNYGENRYLLKAQRSEPDEKGPPQRFGFASHIAVESADGEEEDEE